MDAAAQWESAWLQPGVGFNAQCGVTVDGYALNDTTGKLTGQQWSWTSPAKESIHLGILALALDGNAIAQKLVVGRSSKPAEELAADTLTRKITTFELWAKQFPGFGGFLPWVLVNDTGLTPANGWENTVPGLDNGEFVWGLTAVIQALKKQPSLASLAERYSNYVTMLKRNAVCIFYQSVGHIRAVTEILDTHAAPTPGNYRLSGTGFLDDPYEGELMTDFVYLFGNTPGAAAPPLSKHDLDQLWVNKREKLQAARLTTPSNGAIAVQRGWWFSAHEQWKYLMLPYHLSDINYRVFVNGERARSWNSAMKRIPGMFASVTNVTVNGNGVGPWQYLSAAGVQEVAFEKVTDADVVTPYSTFPMLLAGSNASAPAAWRGTALAWYLTMLQAPRGQTVYGSPAAVMTTGTNVSPLLTWDSKTTTMLAMLGGVSELNQAYLEAEGADLIPKFVSIIDREWSRVFGPLVQSNGQLPGESLPFAVPNATVPLAHVPFATCLPAACPNRVQRLSS